MKRNCNLKSVQKIEKIHCLTGEIGIKKKLEDLQDWQIMEQWIFHLLSMQKKNRLCSFLLNQILYNLKIILKKIGQIRIS